MNKTTHSFLGFDIPIDLMLKTGGGPENFDAIALHHRNFMLENLNLQENQSILELGCGIGKDAIHLATLGPQISSYVGIDIIYDSILWAKENITSKHPNYVFVHNDIKDQLHNSSGERGK